MCLGLLSYTRAGTRRTWGRAATATMGSELAYAATGLRGRGAVGLVCEGTWLACEGEERGMRKVYLRGASSICTDGEDTGRGTR